VDIHGVFHNQGVRTVHEYKIIHLKLDMLDETADLFSRVFAGPPWFEIKKCASCGETYGKGDDLRIFQNGEPCRRCCKPLEIVDYWNGGPAHNVFERAVSSQGFIGLGTRHTSGELIGFSWGYAFPDEDTPTVWFRKAAESLRDQGIDPAETFYAAETGVDPRYQRRGIGSRLMYARFRVAKEVGFKGICGRTTNHEVVRIYTTFFGEESLQPVFNDFDPLKSDRTWYYCPLDQLKSLPEYLDTASPGVSVVAANLGIPPQQEDDDHENNQGQRNLPRYTPDQAVQVRVRRA
jgi:GNAT superfamily N-acetyltransferase